MSQRPLQEPTFLILTALAAGAQRLTATLVTGGRYEVTSGSDGPLRVTVTRAPFAVLLGAWPSWWRGAPSGTPQRWLGR